MNLVFEPPSREWRDAEQVLQELGLTLPEVLERLANYLWLKQAGDLVWISGQGPRNPDGPFITGKVGRDYGLEEAYQHARICSSRSLARTVATLRASVGMGSLPGQITVEIEAMIRVVEGSVGE